MKKTKLLMPLAAVTALGAITPIVMTVTSCNKGGSSTEYASKEDKQFIKNLNERLEDYKDEMTTCYQAWNLATTLGYDLANYKLSNGESVFTYDAHAKQFIIMHGDDVVGSSDGYTKPSNKFDLWRFVDTYDANLGYSQCLKDNYDYDETNGAMVIKTGIDVGSNKNIKNMVYQGDESNPRTVTIRTYSDMLTINAAKDTVNHFGTSNNIYVTGDSATTSTYREVGSAAYVRAKNIKFVVGYAADTDVCSVDTFEAVGTVTGSRDSSTEGMVYTSVGNKIEAIGALYNPTVKSVGTIADLIAINKTSAFIRLTADLTFTTGSINWSITNATPATTISIILDLAGHTISDKDETTLDYGTGRIYVGAGCALIIMDSSRSDKNGVALYNHSIIIEGDASYQANLLLNGAHIAYFATTEDANRGAIYVGHTGKSTETYNSRFFMYGGSVNAYIDDDLDTGCICISPRNSGSYVQIIYGTVYSDQTCISGNGIYDNSYVDIIGGEFEAGNEYPCIYVPQQGTLDITGGSFVGGTDITIRAGTLKISGGSFVALGKYSDPKTGEGGAVIDGSNILVDANASYDTQINITVSGSTMYSLNSYALRGIGQDNWTGYVDADFFGGNFLYKKGNVGYGVDTNVAQNYRIGVVDGHWIKH